MINKLAKNLFHGSLFLIGFTFIIDSLLIFIRKSDSFLNPQFWAEDGSVFFLQAHNLKFESLLQPYAGYLHLFPRIIALFAKLFPTQYAPFIYNYSSLIPILLFLILLYSKRIDLNLSTKFIIGISIVAAPVNGEIFMNITNSQWILALIIILLIISRKPILKLEVISDFMLLALAGFTGPFIIIFLPIFLLKLILGWNSHTVRIFILSVLIALIQITNIDYFSRAEGSSKLFNFEFFRVFSVRSSKILFNYLSNLPNLNGFFEAIASLIVIALYSYYFYNLIYSEKKHKLLLRLSVPLAGLLVFLSTLFAFRAYPEFITYGSDRYFYIFIVTFLWTLIFFKEKHEVLGNLLLITILASFIPYISSQQEKPFIDYKWKESSKCVNVQTPCVIPINPQGWLIDMENKDLQTPYGWKAEKQTE